MPEKKLARFVRPGEMLAMSPTALHQGPQGMFWMLGAGPKPNERIEDVTIIHVRGELEHHMDPQGQSESYENILKKFKAACSGQDLCDLHKEEYLKAHFGDPSDYEAIDGIPPSAIIMCIDSPGGVVAGLNETVKAIQKLRKETKIRTIAFVNETAASAAYALSCACEEIVAPKSAIVGSIGVISTMISQAKKNEMEGFDVRLMVSGARKADGHLHAPITDDMVSVEQTRVDRLANDFFKMASLARSLPVAKIASFEANIFLGNEAYKRGLVDAVMSFDDVLLGASKKDDGVQMIPQSGGNDTDRRITKSVMPKRKLEAATMPISLDALIKKTEAALVTEKDPQKLMQLAASLSAFKKTKKHVEHTETEEAEEPCDEEAEEEENYTVPAGTKGEEEEEEASAKPPMKKGAKAPPFKKKGEEDDEEDETEEKAAKAALALVYQATGMKGRQALGAMAAIVASQQSMSLDVAALKKDSIATKKSALIEKNKGKYLTKADCEWLRTQKLSTVEGFVAQRIQAGYIVNTDESMLVRPKETTPGSMSALPPEVQEIIEGAVAGFQGDSKAKDAFRAKLVSANLETHNKQVSAALNGAGRY